MSNIITITNNHTSLTIVNGANTRTINKAIIREVSILKNNVLKLDIGGGALRNIFLPIAEITLPTHRDAIELADKLNTMLVPQDETILNDLTDLSETIGSMQARLAGMMPATLQQPLLVDDSNPYVIFSGFGAIGANTESNEWAIMRTKITDDGIQVNQWVNGTQNLESSWDARFNYTYQ